MVVTELTFGCRLNYCFLFLIHFLIEMKCDCVVHCSSGVENLKIVKCMLIGGCAVAQVARWCFLTAVT